MKKQKVFKNSHACKRGSILAYSLLVLAVMFAIACSMSTVSILESKSAGSSEASAQAFQSADSGMQLAKKMISRDYYGPLSDVGSCSVIGSIATVHLTSASLGAGAADLSFFPTGSSTALSSCGDTLDKVANIKSVGTFGSTERAVSVALTADITTALKSVNTMLQTYQSAYGSYPVSSGWQGYCSSYGASLGLNWIPELGVALPIDPRNNGSCWDSPGVGQYIYQSNGTDYKLLSHVPASMNVPANLIDPTRPTWAWGWWTSGAAAW